MMVVIWLMAKVWSIVMPPSGLVCVSVWKEEKHSIARRRAAEMNKIPPVTRSAILSHGEFICDAHEI